MLVMLVKRFYFLYYVAQLCDTFCGLVLVNSLGSSAEETQSMLFVLCSLGGSLGASKEVNILLLLEVDIVVPVRMRILCGVISIVLPERVAPEVRSFTVIPSFEFKIGNASASVEVGDCHGALVSVVVDHLCTEVPLFLFTETFEHVVRANFHNANFVAEAVFG